MIEKLLEQGIHCMPLRKKSKFPALPSGYSTIDYSLNGISFEQAEEWDHKFPIDQGYGVAMFCGKASNITWVDVDTNDPEVAAIFPYSPLKKKGKTGLSIGYKYNPYIQNKLRIGVDDAAEKDFIEILNDGAYTVLPPSIHPETDAPYIWIGEDTLDFIDTNSLPELTTATLETVRYYYKKKYGDKFDSSSTSRKDVDLDGVFKSTDNRCAHGSHDRIVKKATQLVLNNTPIETAVKELVDYDNTHHLGITYFDDSSRGKDSSADPATNALRIISNIAHNINSNKKKKGERPNRIIDTPVPLGMRKEAPLVITEKAGVLPTNPKMPKITGKMKIFVDYLNKFALGDNSEAYLGAALAWLSMCVSSRYAIKINGQVTPCNLMIWDIIPSGMGKDAPQALLQKLLYKHNVLGANSYKSAPSILMGLNNVFVEKKGTKELLRKAQRENLMMIDECSSLFRIALQGETYQKDIIETLNTLFSRSSGFFAGDQSIDRGAKYGAAHNPYFTVLGFTTYDNFRELMGAKIIGNGFFERSLVFIKKTKGTYNKHPVKDEDMYFQLQNFTDFLMDKPIRLVDHGEIIPVEKEITTEVAYEEFPINGDAERYLSDYRERLYNFDAHEVDLAFYNRFVEIATKLALLHAVSEERAFASLEDVTWGVGVVEWAYANARPVYERIKEGSDIYEEAAKKIYIRLSKLDGNRATRSDIFINVRMKFAGSKSKFLTEVLEMDYFKTEIIDGTQWISLKPDSKFL